MRGWWRDRLCSRCCGEGGGGGAGEKITDNPLARMPRREGGVATAGLVGQISVQAGQCETSGMPTFHGAEGLKRMA